MGGREEKRVSKVRLHLWDGGRQGDAPVPEGYSSFAFYTAFLSGSRNFSVPSPNSGLTSPGRLHYPLLFPVPPAHLYKHFLYQTVLELPTLSALSVFCWYPD